jgi:hypothetical protein
MERSFIIMSLGHWFNKRGECFCFLRLFCIVHLISCLRSLSKAFDCTLVMIILWNFTSLESQCKCN